jgi:hypothetical protein
VNSLPGYPRWRPLGSADKPLLDRYCQSYAPYAEATLATLMVWNEPGACRITELNGNVIVRHQSCGGGNVLTPLGRNRPVGTALELLSAADVRLRLVPDYSIAGTPAACWHAGSLEVQPDPDNDDYVFEIDQLATLAGPQLKGRRKRRNGFVREHRPEPCLLDLSSASEADQVIRCAETWFRQVELNNDDPPAEELRGLQYLLGLTVDGALDGLLGFGVRVGSDLVAVSIVETHGTDTVSGVVFKASRDLPGAGEYLRSTSAAALGTMGYRRINAQQDLGRPGLRRMKSSYRPSTMFRKWTIQTRHEGSPC